MKSRLPALDGLRAIAVGLVLIEHSMMIPDFSFRSLFDFTRPGTDGVRLFFVLSGWLITGILWDAREKTVDRWHIWRAFYLRRALRIFPLALVAIGVAALFDYPDVRAHWAWYVGYLANYRIASLKFGSGLLHFWSLGVEEQFYLVWPLVILWVPRRILSPVLLLLICASALTRGFVAAWLGNVPAYTWTMTRVDALAVGGWLALAVRQGRSVSWSIVAILGGIAVLIGQVGSASWHALWAESGFVLLTASLLLLTLSWSPLSRVLSWRPLTFLGTISYGVYVWHMVWPPLVPKTERMFDIWLRFPVQPGVFRFFAVSAGTLIVAWISWACFERPLNDLKDRFPYIPSGHRDRSSLLPGTRSRLVAVTND